MHVRKLTERTRNKVLSQIIRLFVEFIFLFLLLKNKKTNKIWSPLVYSLAWIIPYGKC